MSVFSKKIDYNLVENSSFFNNNPSHLKSINSYEDLLAWEMKILNKVCSSECAIKKVVLESFLNQMDELLSKNQKVIVKFYSSGSGSSSSCSESVSVSPSSSSFDSDYV